MPIVSFVSFESIRGRRAHEGIFISKSLNLNQACFYYNEPPSPSTPSPIVQQSMSQLHDSLSSNSTFTSNGPDQHSEEYTGSSSEMTSQDSIIEGTFIELFVRKDRTSSRLKIQHFFKLNDQDSQQMICLRQIGKISSIPNFFAFLRTIPLPTPGDHILNPEALQVAHSNGSVMVPTYYAMHDMARFEKSLLQISREWYILVIREAEIQKVLKKKY